MVSLGHNELRNVECHHERLNLCSYLNPPWNRMAVMPAGNIFKYIFLNENLWISLNISLNFVPKGHINNVPALVQIMAWRRRQAIIWKNDGLGYWHIYASLGLNELTCEVLNFCEETQIEVHSQRKQEQTLFHKVSIMVIVSLVMEGARTSAAMVLT